MLPPTIFFFVVFNIILFTRALMAKQYGINFTHSAVAMIGALVVGKSILIADALPFVNWFRQRRLIYNIAWKTFLYVCIVVFFQFAEELIPLIIKCGALSTAGKHFIDEFKWPQFWATNILFVLFLVFYNLTTGIMGAVGRRELIEIFFGARSNHATKGD